MNDNTHESEATRDYDIAVKEIKINDSIAKQLDTLADQWNELTHEQKYTK